MSKSFMYELINSPSFPKIKIGKQFFIPEDELDAWVKNYTYGEFKIGDSEEERSGSKSGSKKRKRKIKPVNISV